MSKNSMFSKDNLPLITIRDCNEFVGLGAYGIVFKISPTRVVKIFKYNTESSARRELRGSTLSKHALPVLSVVKIKFKVSKKQLKKYTHWKYDPEKKYTGFVREYIPYHCTHDDATYLRNKLKGTKKGFRLCWDLAKRNIRKDEKGKVWIVDTDVQ